VDPEQIDLLRSYSATEWQIFKMVKLPNALPYVFAGLNISVVLSILGAIVGEFVGAQSGLGSLLMQMNIAMDIRGVFSVLIILSAMGLALHYLVTKLEKKVLFWAPKERIFTGV
jgi:NitT/TauT family transport system permease protein